MPKVSVIIPVYGVEKYIERCARSLLEQTLDDIELIFVDDCTKDNSITILREVIECYPMRKSQIRILHHDVNKGLPSARKTGLLVARGEYIAHCDSDDWVDRNMYLTMYENAAKEKVDVIVCDYIVTDGGGKEDHLKACHSTNRDKFIENLLYQKDPWVVWNKMFSRKIYSKDFVYAKGNMGEDMVTCAQLILKCKKIAYLPQPLYYYFCNPESITKHLTTDTILRNFEALKTNTDIILSRYSREPYWKNHSGLLYIQYNVKAHLFPIIHKKEFRKLFMTTYPGLFKLMLFKKDIPWICKLKFLISLAGLYPKKVNN